MNTIKLNTIKLNTIKQIASLAALLVLTAGAANAQEMMSHEGMDHSAHQNKHGSDADQKAVRQTVDALFDAMRTSDSEAFSALFHEQARLMSTGTRNGQPFLAQTDLAQFAESVADAEKGSLDERIWDVMIHIDGSLATAWTPYAFYHNGNFSHCGVNAFQMVASPDGWKILQITDTRQQEGCEIPESVGD
jgi:ketosteroid isomerase-like protein